MLTGFGKEGLDPRLTWDHEPPRWDVESDGDVLACDVMGGTNYWQRTRHGRRDDNGHFLALSITNDFEMTVTVSAMPNTQYDQAGLMIRDSADCWIKTSAEYEEPGWSRLGAVVTNHGWSDWSTQNVGDGERRLRIRRIGGDVIVDAATGTDPWSQLRVAHLVYAADSVRAGVYACAPRGSGFPVRFRSFALDTVT
ncbi:MAG: DUF1349 domain-containing protein [Acidimicrobiales bacterium]|nr:DUF1349 domain-containing protein [Acidimicrobiales bacterium]